MRLICRRTILNADKAGQTDLMWKRGFHRGDAEGSKRICPRNTRKDAKERQINCFSFRVLSRVSRAKLFLTLYLRRFNFLVPFQLFSGLFRSIRLICVQKNDRITRNSHSRPAGRSQSRAKFAATQLLTSPRFREPLLHGPMIR